MRLHLHSKFKSNYHQSMRFQSNFLCARGPQKHTDNFNGFSSTLTTIEGSIVNVFGMYVARLNGMDSMELIVLIVFLVLYVHSIAVSCVSI